MHLEGFPPHNSHSLPGSRLAKPPQEPVIGFLPNNTPTDIAVIINMRTKNMINISSMTIF